jgi:hypothetical protein
MLSRRHRATCASSWRSCRRTSWWLPSSRRHTAASERLSPTPWNATPAELASLSSPAPSPHNQTVCNSRLPPAVHVQPCPTACLPSSAVRFLLALCHIRIREALPCVPQAAPRCRAYSFSNPGPRQCPRPAATNLLSQSSSPPSPHIFLGASGRAHGTADVTAFHSHLPLAATRHAASARAAAASPESVPFHTWSTMDGMLVARNIVHCSTAQLIRWHRQTNVWGYCWQFSGSMLQYSPIVVGTGLKLCDTER